MSVRTPPAGVAATERTPHHTVMLGGAWKLVREGDIDGAARWLAVNCHLRPFCGCGRYFTRSSILQKATSSGVFDSGQPLDASQGHAQERHMTHLLSSFMHTHTRTHTHIHIHSPTHTAHIHTYTHTHIHTYTHTHTHTHTHTKHTFSHANKIHTQHTRTHTHTHTHSLSHTHHTYTRTHTHAHAHAHAAHTLSLSHTHTRTHAHTHSHTNTRTHTHTHSTQPCPTVPENFTIVRGAWLSVARDAVAVLDDNTPQVHACCVCCDWANIAPTHHADQTCAFVQSAVSAQQRKRTQQ